MKGRPMWQRPIREGKKKEKKILEEGFGNEGECRS